MQLKIYCSSIKFEFFIKYYREIKDCNFLGGIDESSKLIEG